MKTFVLNGSLLSFCLLGMSACNAPNPLPGLVDADVQLNPPQQVATGTSSIAYTGNLTFHHTRLFTSYRQVCDTQVCGYDSRVECSNYEVCHPVDSPVCENGHCNGNQPHDVCHTEQECRQVTEPRYCEVNCRNEPFNDSSTDDILSPLQVTIANSASGILSAAGIQTIEVGVRTNDNYRMAFDNPAGRPQGSESLFASLSRDDNTIVVLRATGLKLSAGQDAAIQIPQGFRAGDPLNIALKVEPSSSTDTTVSAVGSKLSLPEISYSTDERQ